METAIAAQDPRPEGAGPGPRSGTCARWKTSSITPAAAGCRSRSPAAGRVTIDRNLWGASIYLHDLADAWEEPPADIFT